MTRILLFNPSTSPRETLLRGSQQVAIIAYIDDYKLLLVACLAAIPLLVIFTRSSGAGGRHVVIGE
jgi:hypothetical protein